MRRSPESSTLTSKKSPCALSPGLEQVRRALRDGACDVLLAHAVDRLSRNQNHIGVLLDEAEEAGVRLDFVTEEFEQTLVGQFILAA